MSGTVDSLLVTWFYGTASCNGTVPPLNSLPQTRGIAVLVADGANDFTLVGLDRGSTGGVVFAGYDPNSWADGPATIIHHPDGSWKRITFATKSGTKGSCVGGAQAGWDLVIAKGAGEIEPGSSGSPVFDSAQRIRGVGSCASWDCDTADSATYGRLEQAYPLLAPYLDPVDPVYVDAGFTGVEQGTSANPFDRLIEGVFAVTAGSDVYLEGGTYGGAGTFDKPMTLRSRGGAATIQ